LERLPVPDSTPAISTLHVDQRGYLWIGRWWGSGADGEPVYDVFDTNGRWLGPVVIPAALGRILSIGDDRLLTRMIDQAGVQSVGVYRLRK